MKTPPNDPEFQRFTAAMRRMMKVSKTEMQRRLEWAKGKPKTAAGRAAVSASKSRV